MPLVLTRRSNDPIPVEVDAINPTALAGLDCSAIAKLNVWRGRHQRSLESLFEVEGSLAEDQTIQWKGPLEAVHQIAAGQSVGATEVFGNAGRHAGDAMSGGQLIVRGDAGDFLGAEMTGGTIMVTGNASDHVGTVFPGEKFGMNRGTILIRGSVGRGLGKAMRRGTIVVGGTAEDPVGWNMRAGTIIVMGGCRGAVGSGMRRGTIVDCQSGDAVGEQTLLPTFLVGPTNSIPIVNMLGRSIANFELDGAPFFPTESLAKLSDKFTVFHGDQLQGGRGEVLVRSVSVS